MQGDPASPNLQRRRRLAAWLAVALILALVASVNAGYLEKHPFPAYSSHHTWRLVPRITHHLAGYDHYRPSQQGPTFLGGGGSFYPLPTHEPIPWTSPTGLWDELRQDGRLYQLWGYCPTGFFACLPHAFVVPAAVANLAPGRRRLVAMVPTFYFLALLVGLYGIGSEVGGRATGVAAAAIAAGYPGLFGFARWPEGYVPAAALSVLMVWCLLRSRGLTRWRPLVVFAVLAWTAIRNGEGFSEGVGAGLAVSGPFLVELLRGPWEALRQRRLPWRWAVGVAIVAGALLTTTDWYWVQDALEQTFLGFTEHVHGGSWEGGEWSAPDASWSPSGLGVYPLFVYQDYLRPLMVGWLLVGAILLLVRWPRHGVTLLLWLVVPLVAYTSMARKAIWYPLPILPPLAVITAVGLSRVPWRRVRATALGLAALSGLFQLLAFSPPVLPVTLNAPRALARPARIEVPDVRWVDLLAGMSPENQNLRRQADVLLAWLDREVSTDGGLKYLGVVSPWGHDIYPAMALSWYVTLARPDVAVVELAERRYFEQGYPGLSSRTFALLACHDEQGIFRSCVDDAGRPVLSAPERRDEVPPPLTRFARLLLEREQGVIPELPAVHVLDHATMEGVRVVGGREE